MSATVEIITPHENNPVAEFFSSPNTPETDAQVTTFSSISKFKKRFLCSTGRVSAEFARRLERERDEAREALENYKASTVHSCNEECKRPMCVLRRERNEAREDAAKLADRLSGLELSTTQALARLEQERNQARKPAAWIPVARALPDDDMTVLIHLADGGVEAGFLDAGAWRFVSGDRTVTPVLHWRPFPDAPPPSK